MAMRETSPGAPGLRLSPLFLGLQVLLLALAVSRYDATSFVFRGTSAIDFFNWFWRHRFLSFLSFFDLLIGALLGLTLLGVAASGRWRRRPFDSLIYALVLLVVVSSVIRFLHRDVEDSLQGFLFQLRNYAYFAAAYVVASRLAWTPRRTTWLAGFLTALAGLAALLSWWEISHTPPPLLVSKYGRPVNVRDISDYPLTFLFQFFALALLLERVPMRRWQKALVLAVVAYSLYGVFSGVGKGVLVVYPAVFFYFAWHYRFFTRRWFVAGLASLLVLVTGLGAYVVLNADRFDPASPFYVYTTFSSRDLSVSTRGVELLNFASNLYERKALLLGIGLGNKWFSYWPQPEEDLGAFPPPEWGSDWHLGMHVPLLRLTLDFGLLGLGAVLALFAACFLSTMRALRSGGFDGVARAFMLSSWAVIGYQITVNNLSGPKTNLLAGVLLGVVAGILSERSTSETG